MHGSYFSFSLTPNQMSPENESWDDAFDPDNPARPEFLRIDRFVEVPLRGDWKVLKTRQLGKDVITLVDLTNMRPFLEIWRKDGPLQIRVYSPDGSQSQLLSTEDCPPHGFLVGGESARGDDVKIRVCVNPKTGEVAFMNISDSERVALDFKTYPGQSGELTYNDSILEADFHVPRQQSAPTVHLPLTEDHWLKAILEEAEGQALRPRPPHGEMAEAGPAPVPRRRPHRPDPLTWERAIDTSAWRAVRREVAAERAGVSLRDSVVRGLMIGTGLGGAAIALAASGVFGYRLAKDRMSGRKAKTGDWTCPTQEINGQERDAAHDAIDEWEERVIVAPLSSDAVLADVAKDYCRWTEMPSCQGNEAPEAAWYCQLAEYSSEYEANADHPYPRFPRTLAVSMAVRAHALVGY